MPVMYARVAPSSRTHVVEVPVYRTVTSPEPLAWVNVSVAGVGEGCKSEGLKFVLEPGGHLDESGRRGLQ